MFCQEEIKMMYDYGKQPDREQVAEDVTAFLNKGGVIHSLAPEVSRFNNDMASFNWDKNDSYRKSLGEDV